MARVPSESRVAGVERTTLVPVPTSADRLVVTSAPAGTAAWLWWRNEMLVQDNDTHGACRQLDLKRPAPSPTHLHPHLPSPVLVTPATPSLTLVWESCTVVSCATVSQHSCGKVALLCCVQHSEHSCGKVVLLCRVQQSVNTRVGRLYCCVMCNTVSQHSCGKVALLCRVQHSQ